MKKIKLIIDPKKRLSIISFHKPLLEYTVKILKKRGTEKYAIITDKNVFQLYGKKLGDLLQKEKIEHEFFVIPAGEQNKNLQTLESLAEKLLQKGITRSETMIAFGGGMVGDLTGLLSSLYMRGMPLIQIPTTLLAMVDASIGGKTGVNLKPGKNLLGTFHQPSAIYINPYFLGTLSKDQIKNALAEVIKYGVIRDKKLFKILEQHKEEILNLSVNYLNKILVRSINIKLDIVSQDERENGLRMLLNYGHTVGHAIEKLSNYSLYHGQAIAIGMIEENNWAVSHEILKPSHADRIKNLIELYELPTEIPQNIKAAEIRQTIGYDKKHRGKTLYLCVPKKIGKAVIIPYQ